MGRNRANRSSPRRRVNSRDGFADLHMHTLFSDGFYSVEQIIRMAERRGLRAISITDHDNIDSFEVGSPLAEELGVELIPGIEISAVHDGRDVHVLGYFCDVTHLGLNMELKEQARRRQNRVRAIIRRLHQLGVELTYEKVLSNCKGKVIGRPHIAEALIQEEYVGSFGEAFSKYLAKDAAAFVEKKGISPVQAIRLIEHAGGVASLAHPYKSDVDDLIEEMVENGLKGIETYSHSQRGGIARKYRDIAEKYGLIGTGGSDFHNDQSQCDLGALRMPYSVVEQLKEVHQRFREESF
jgi:predicted metal-dependent phosphoesterase TrpH